MKVFSLDADALALAFQQRESVRFRPGDAPRHAGVALVFCPEASGIQLLFIQRAVYPGDPWSGHMAFPGGHQDLEDAGPRAAAERELFEEVGIDVRAARRLGVLDAVYSPAQLAHRIGVQPFAYWVEQVPELRPNHEVDTAHWIPIDVLLDPASRSSFNAAWEGREYSLPMIGWCEQRIWGMTLRIVDDFAARVASLNEA